MYSNVLEGLRDKKSLNQFYGGPDAVNFVKSQDNPLELSFPTQFIVDIGSTMDPVCLQEKWGDKVRRDLVLLGDERDVRSHQWSRLKSKNAYPNNLWGHTLISPIFDTEEFVNTEIPKVFKLLNNHKFSLGTKTYMEIRIYPTELTQRQFGLTLKMLDIIKIELNDLLIGKSSTSTTLKVSYNEKEFRYSNIPMTRNSWRMCNIIYMLQEIHRYPCHNTIIPGDTYDLYDLTKSHILYDFILKNKIADESKSINSNRSMNGGLPSR